MMCIKHLLINMMLERKGCSLRKLSGLLLVSFSPLCILPAQVLFDQHVQEYGLLKFPRCQILKRAGQWVNKNRKHRAP